MNHSFRLASALFIILVAVYFLGPAPEFGPVTNEPMKLELSLQELEAFVRARRVPDVRPGNASELVWADSLQKTEYSIVYLHGFSASPMEGDPLHKNIARRFGCNLYIPRLEAHGLSNLEAFKGLTPGKMVESAREAIAIGKVIGEKVIVMGTSTGATLAIYLAASDPSVEALVLLSPNIRLHDPAAFLLDQPWGSQIARLVIGDDYRVVNYPEEVRPYWYSRYHNDGLVALQRLLDETMTEETFNAIYVPVFMGYYYKNEKEMDKVVSVKAMRKFFEAVSTPGNRKQSVAFADGTDHVIGSSLKNPHWKSVEQEVSAFLEGEVFTAGYSPFVHIPWRNK